MSDNSLFDDIMRILASPIPRREAFRLIARGLAGGALVSLLEPQQAHAALMCGEICGVAPPNGKCSDSILGKCPKGSTCGGSVASRCQCCQRFCTVKGVFTDCCCNGQICCNGKCSPPGSCCADCPGDTTGQITAIRVGPPARAEVTIQNAVEGIDSITLAKAVNCTVPGLPVTTPDVTTPFAFTATKIDQTQPAQFAFSVCTPGDCCCDLDPIFTVLKLTTGRWVRQTFAGTPSAEHFLTVTNGAPGLNRLHIWVNSRHVATLRLKDNETQSLDLAAAMTLRNNTISLVGAGELGASAAVNIVDTPPAHDGATAATQALGSGPWHNPIWGPLAEATEENSDLHAATAASQTVQINFSGALSNAAASSSKVFTVEVDGKAVTVQGAHVQASVAGLDLTLQLPQGTFHSGDSVDVYWENLRGANGRPLSGHVPLLAE